jgi:hypothetical protein
MSAFRKFEVFISKILEFLSQCHYGFPQRSSRNNSSPQKTFHAHTCLAARLGARLRATIKWSPSWKAIASSQVYESRLACSRRAKGRGRHVGIWIPRLESCGDRDGPHIAIGARLLADRDLVARAVVEGPACRCSGLPPPLFNMCSSLNSERSGSRSAGFPCLLARSNSSASCA